MLQEPLQVLEVLQRLDQFLQVLQPPRRLGRLVVLPHRGIAGFLQDHLGQFDMADPRPAGGRRSFDLDHRSGSGSGPAAPSASSCQRSNASTSAAISPLALPPISPSATAIRAASSSGTPCVAGDHLQRLLRLVAHAALGRVDDALEGQVVVGPDGDAEIGHRVADLQPLVEPRPADHPVGQADGQEPVLEGPHLVAGADQDRAAVQPDRLHARGCRGPAPPAPRRSSAPLPRRPNGRSAGASRPRSDRSTGSCPAGPCWPRSRPEAAARICGVER